MSRTWKGFDIIAQDLDATNVRITDEQIAKDEKLKQAVEHKNKLIDFDRSRFLILFYIFTCLIS